MQVGDKIGMDRIHGPLLKGCCKSNKALPSAERATCTSVKMK